MLPTDPAVLRVLLIDNDPDFSASLSAFLEAHGALVTARRDGREGLVEALRGVHDLVLLETDLPGLSGVEVCREIRSRLDTPIIFVAALGQEVERVLGLELGADDFVSKPLSERELLARIRSRVRRARSAAGPAARQISIGPLTLDPKDRSIRLQGEPLRLTVSERALLWALGERPGRVLTREVLLELMRGNSSNSFDRAIDVVVARVRQKLREDSRHPRLLKTVRGVGYLLAPAAEM